MKKILPLFLFVATLASCSKSDPEPSILIDSPTIELKYDQTHQYLLKKGSESIFSSTFKWKSSNEKVGTVDANGVFTARKIGETVITGTSDGQNVESKVTIAPYVTLFTEPVVDFGASMATVKSKEKRKLLTETSAALAYEGVVGTQTRGVVYVFTDQKLASAGILFDNTTATVNLSSTFLKERYPDRATIDGKAYLLNDERTVGVMVSVDPSYGYTAIYLPLNSNARISPEYKKQLITTTKDLLKSL